MLLHFKDFEEKYKSVYSQTSMLKKHFLYTKKQAYNDIGEIQKYLLCKTADTFAHKKRILTLYFQFLLESDYVSDDDLKEAYTFLISAKRSDYVDIQYFANLDELIDTINKDIVTVENTFTQSNYLDVKTYFLLSWYQIGMKDYISIRLDDINANEKSIYVPTLDTTINLDKRVFDVVMLYASQSSELIAKNNTRPTTLFQPIENSKDLKRSISNRRNKFVSIIRDKRYASQNIAVAAVINEIRQMELKLNRIISLKDIINLPSAKGKSTNRLYSILSIYHSTY